MSDIEIMINWNPFSIITSIEAKLSSKSIKSEDTSKDRDPSGNSGYDSQKQKRKLTEAELEIALIHIKSLDSVQKNSWIVKLTKENSFHCIQILDSNNRLIRKIPELELWTLVENYDEKNSKGALFNKIL